MSIFKVGDKVRCINDINSGSYLSLGKVYIVKYVDVDYYGVWLGVLDSDIQNTNGWKASRFELVSTSCDKVLSDNLWEDYSEMACNFETLKETIDKPKQNKTKYLAMFNKTTMEIKYLSLTKDQLDNKIAGKWLDGYEEIELWLNI